jgi:hypothetical protein
MICWKNNIKKYNFKEKEHKVNEVKEIITKGIRRIKERNLEIILYLC